MFIPNSKLDMPELLYPGRKPVGNVKIDWSNPLSRGIKIANIPRLNFATGSVQKYTVGHSINGEYLGFNDGDSTSFFTVNDDTQRLQTFTASVIVDINRTSIGYLWNSDVRALIVIGKEGAGSSVISAAWYDGSFRFLSAPTTLTGHVRVDFVKKEGVFAALYIDGQMVAENTTNLNNVVYNSSRGASIGASQFNYGNTSLDFNLYDFTYRDVALSAVEIKALHDSAYQFYVPA